MYIIINVKIMKKLTYEDLIEKIGIIVNDTELLKVSVLVTRCSIVFRGFCNCTESVNGGFWPLKIFQME